MMVFLRITHLNTLLKCLFSPKERQIKEIYHELCFTIMQSYFTKYEMFMHHAL